LTLQAQSIEYGSQANPPKSYAASQAGEDSAEGRAPDAESDEKSGDCGIKK
jgi:hypothetical protein